ncbi:MAG: DUF3943 domain-containing protein [Betaproteobacteria bacterium]
MNRFHHHNRVRGALLIAAFGLASIPASGATAENRDSPDLPLQWAAAANDSVVSATPVSSQAPRAEAGKSYATPALEIVGFDVLLNLFDRAVLGSDFKSNLSTIRRNLHSSWTVDSDPFRVNQLGHPYQGSMYHGFARSAGLNYWESLGYTFAGSAFWEIAGEATPPSRNDQITTGIGGTFLGEALFRMASLLLEHDEVPPFWRELGAAAISPSTGFNRLAFGNRYDAIFASHNPAHYTRLQIGFSGTAQNDSGTATTKLNRNEALADFAIDYGLPGKPGYTYKRPFDYFTFQATASSANGFENLMTRGLLIGKDYALGESYRGVWGLYGSYDYISPQTFRVASTGLSLGTTAQWWLSQRVALQGTALLGAGYAAVGTTRSTVENDYHYGVAPQALASLRLIVGDRVSMDLTARDYFVSRVAAADRGGHDNIARVDASVTVRVRGRHGISLKYLGNRRDAFYPDLGNTGQTRATIGIFYTLLGHEKFGAVEW